MDQKTVPKVFSILKKHVLDYDVPVVDLIAVQTDDPFKVLVATILSARTKDETTAAACKRLFAKADTPEKLSKLTTKQIEKLIFPVGFFRNKASHLKKLPTVLKEEFRNVIPHDIDNLIKLPGVGRKTANLVRAVAFSKHAICVDIHVHRIMNRLGYIKTKTPLDSEMTLRAKLPKKYWKPTNRILVAFGQKLCRPVSPHCSICPIRKYCKQIGVTSTR